VKVVLFPAAGREIKQNKIKHFHCDLCRSCGGMELVMKDGVKKTIVFLFFLLAGIVAGTIAAELLRGVSWLEIMSRNLEVGLDTANPLVLDLIVFKLALGFTLSVNIWQIIFVIIAFVIYAKVAKSL
jgi:hypothetical protein